MAHHIIFAASCLTDHLYSSCFPVHVRWITGIACILQASAGRRWPDTRSLNAQANCCLFYLITCFIQCFRGWQRCHMWYCAFQWVMMPLRPGALANINAALCDYAARAAPSDFQCQGSGYLLPQSIEIECFWPVPMLLARTAAFFNSGECHYAILLS